MSSQYISIRGARVHNLKNLNVDFPNNELIAVTGLSGSGKSTLVFDTLFAEGQRRYVESLSSYARQFLGRMSKPEVDSISGIPPAIAIEQKVNSRNPRSTVGTSTEIYDYLKLLFARTGHTISPKTGKEIRIFTVTDVVNHALEHFDQQQITILTPIPTGKSLEEESVKWVAQGFSRVALRDDHTLQILRIEEVLQTETWREKLKTATELYLVVDRLAVKKDDDELRQRLADSLQTAYNQSGGYCQIYDNTNLYPFSAHFEEDGISFQPLTPHLFSFNNPLGSCPNCDGFGMVLGIDPDLVIPNPSLTIYEDAIACWKGQTMKFYKEELIDMAKTIEIPIHKPYIEFTEEQRLRLWNGYGNYRGIHGFFTMLETQKSKMQSMILLARYRGKTICPVCNGQRLRQEALCVKVGGKNIAELCSMPIETLYNFFQHLSLSAYEQQLAGRALTEIRLRLQYLLDVGLPYLTLNRLSNTLSGGESQRINLATILGSNLEGSLYILDEPSIGLHPRDTQRLIKVLKALRDLGNTVVVVEHEESIIRAADRIIDIGPLAGEQGGEVVFAGKIEEYSEEKYPNTLTLPYLLGKQSIELPPKRRTSNLEITLTGARINNLKNITVSFPLGIMTAVTGVSGSGKSSLVKEILYPALCRHFNISVQRTSKFDKLTGDLSEIQHVEMVDQNPIGKSSRSNPVTYIKAYDEIRKLYSEQPYAKRNHYGHSHFSFNIDGGRCDECQGEGTVRIDMQFMADVVLTCESCGGQRFKKDILEVKYKGLNIADVLNLSVNQAITFFKGQKESAATKVAERLQPLQDVGLGYIKLGQNTNTLSGGESQRVKLAYFLTKENRQHHTLFIFDEPTTGLHFHDIKKLLQSFNALINNNNTVIVIEHNVDVIRSADYVIDLGKEGGDSGGNVVFKGTPEDLKQCKDSYTGQYLTT